MHIRAARGWVADHAEDALPDDRSAALLVRVWLEDGTDQFRARVTAVGRDESEDDRTVALASSPSELVHAVGEWLDGFVGGGATTE
ncbi:hypothetical protein QOZ88_03030 [Blastococcus sp. BMG 814]|uniref:Uncharacterized protein n=1 Tax=Blastococcus carthaginiensis TaxID=3050034 RepID=A0ABT9I8W2_9ACTN|nr:hypothetical protein [Blastococcus carthaginiensis]MDP5181599.1 hypothetical protein [Blastococcus carthaginiensis]